MESGIDPLPVSRVKRGGDGVRGIREKKGVEQLGPPPRRRQVGAAITQPLTAREYLQAARTTAREKVRADNTPQLTGDLQYYLLRSKS